MEDRYDQYVDDNIDYKEPLSPVKRFFFSCAGAYMRILEVTPSEHNKYIGIGATIFLTACMAVISGSFAIYTIIPNPVVSVLFGFLWGALIFNLDRYIVSSMRKEGRMRHELMLALPRLSLAVLISIVITKPIEVELFRNQINSELFGYTAELQKDAEQKLDSKLGLDSLRAELARVDSLRFEYKKIKDGKPTSFTFGEVSREYNEARSKYESTRSRNDNRIKANEKMREQIWEKYAVKIYDTVGNKPVFKRWELDNRYREQRYRLAQLNSKLQKEIDDTRMVMESLEQSRKAEEEEFKSGIDEEIQSVKMRKEELVAEKHIKDSIRSAELPGALQKAEKYGVGFPAKIEALERLKEASPSIWWISNLIVLLFILLETSPVFVKMIVKRGPYDYMLSRIEHQKKVSALQSISDMNYDLNNAMRRHNGSHLSADVYVNDDHN